MLACWQARSLNDLRYVFYIFFGLCKHEGGMDTDTKQTTHFSSHRSRQRGNAYWFWQTLSTVTRQSSWQCSPGNEIVRTHHRPRRTWSAKNMTAKSHSKKSDKNIQSPHTITPYTSKNTNKTITSTSTYFFIPCEQTTPNLQRSKATTTTTPAMDTHAKRKSKPESREHTQSSSQHLKYTGTYSHQNTNKN